ncbi:MAG: LysM peptidoglycan-binding domain-containing protein [Ardenticatenaceae bacterium]
MVKHVIAILMALLLLSGSSDSLMAAAPQQGEDRAPGYYVVSQFDTPIRIANRFEMDVDELIRVNKISDPRRLKIGTVLIIPGSDGEWPDPDALEVAASASDTSTKGGAYRASSYYVMQNGDTPARIANRFNINVDELMRINQIIDPTRLRVGTVLIIPASDGSFPDPIEKRMTLATQNAPVRSPYYKTTWVTYYGRPNVGAMGILGEYSINGLVPLLRRQARAYDRVNGSDLGVMPAFHLVYGMATKGPSNDGDHLAFLRDEVVLEYIERAKQEGFAVILDIQIGALTPVESLRYGLPFLKHSNVHLALDPEFAMSHPNQSRPGNPIGFVTAEQINAAQEVMHQYMVANNIQGRRILLLHQFLPSMIVRKERLDMGYQKIDLTITADGWGGPWGKIGKYNSFVNEDSKFTGFKLFYRWDRPLLTESEALGVTRHGYVPYVEITPNLIIYQ